MLEPVARRFASLLFAAGIIVTGLLALPVLSDPQLSPDGLNVAYVQDAPDWSQNKRIGHIWRIGIDGQHPEQLTRGERGHFLPSAARRTTRRCSCCRWRAERRGRFLRT